MTQNYFRFSTLIRHAGLLSIVGKHYSTSLLTTTTINNRLCNVSHTFEFVVTTHTVVSCNETVLGTNLNAPPIFNSSILGDVVYKFEYPADVWKAEITLCDNNTNYTTTLGVYLDAGMHTTRIVCKSHWQIKKM